MPPDKKQVSLLSAFNRTWEVIEEPKAKPVGRPPKAKPKESELESEPQPQKKPGRPPKRPVVDLPMRPESFEALQDEVTMEDVEAALEEKEKPEPELSEDAGKFSTPNNVKRAKIQKLSSWEKPERSPEESPEDYSKRCGKAAGQLGKEFGKLGGRKPQERQRGVSTGLTIRTRQLNY